MYICLSGYEHTWFVGNFNRVYFTSSHSITKSLFMNCFHWPLVQDKKKAKHSSLYGPAFLNHTSVLNAYVTNGSFSTCNTASNNSLQAGVPIYAKADDISVILQPVKIKYMASHGKVCGGQSYQVKLAHWTHYKRAPFHHLCLKGQMSRHKRWQGFGIDGWGTISGISPWEVI